MREYIMLNGKPFATYLVTGEIPYGQGLTSDAALSDKAIVSDCIEACHELDKSGIPEDVAAMIQANIDKCARLLWGSLYPWRNSTADSFFAYAKRSGLID